MCKISAALKPVLSWLSDVDRLPQLLVMDCGNDQPRRIDLPVMDANTQVPSSSPSRLTAQFRAPVLLQATDRPRVAGQSAFLQNLMYMCRRVHVFMLPPVQGVCTCHNGSTHIIGVN